MMNDTWLNLLQLPVNGVVRF